MKILLVSDLHTDINKKILKEYNFGFLKKLKEVDVLLICGDIAGSCYYSMQAIENIQKYIEDNNLNTKVLFTIGNHEPYSYDIEHKTIEEINRYLRNNYKGNIHFLQDDYKIIDDYIFFGATMYTNFELYGNPEYITRMVAHEINDFKYCKTGITGNMHTVLPVDYQHKFIKTRYLLKELCKKYKDKNIVVFTHFGPSGNSISENYVGNMLNPYYCSDLENLINKHKNIKLWCHGHTHNQFDYKIGNTTILCNPYGYYGYEQMLTPDEYYGKIVEI